ncbi:MAG: type II toxin-antitoxin system HicB family antitoxin, partial [Chloroflexota bacterium]|nr:type II toxin-antitoxin system HicB family antitoxin [Chloroflexota bacterium]
RLRMIMHEPNDETEGKYLVEVPTLPGCRAWGDTAADALGNLQSVATAFIESYQSRGDTLPKEIEQASVDVTGPGVPSEVLVAA